MVSKLTTLAWIASIAGCAQGNNPNCGKIQSYVVGKTESTGEPMAATLEQFAGQGGMLEVTRGNGNVERCTLALDFDISDSKSFYGWTAEHCIQAETDTNSKLLMYYNKGYRTFDIDFEPYAARDQSLKAIESKPEPLRAQLRTAILNASKRTNIGSLEAQNNTVTNTPEGYCQNETKKVKSRMSSGNQTAVNNQEILINCSSLFELSRFKITLKSEPDSLQKIALEFNKNQYFALNEKTKRTIPTNVTSDTPGVDSTWFRNNLSSWNAGVFGMTQARSQIALAMELDKCFGLNSEFCTALSEIYPTESAAAQGSLQTELKKQNLIAKTTAVRLLWDSFRTLMPKFGKVPVSLGSNFSFVKNSTEALEKGKAELGKLLPTYFLSLPLNELTGSNHPVLAEPTDMQNPIAIANKDFERNIGSFGAVVLDYGVIFIPDSINKPLTFQPGDSGSLVHWDGLFPLFAFSTSNETPFSGGAVLKTLPEPKDEVQQPKKPSETVIQGKETGCSKNI